MKTIIAAAILGVAVIIGAGLVAFGSPEPTVTVTVDTQPCHTDGSGIWTTCNGQLVLPVQQP